ncbi:SDR family oxidoreductase [Croceimicrobium hydrocarbonivorans]|uniref:SDR family oxidoreductase n=1 Tax=Croceimicrobium hydrocarbonivorans TaxID=2761580 RepID=A0A7H0VCH7_9FLAO|nr:SDR family oxidoreductase [Croceimicrobium hydrocarbonivorans]QNR23425.1 SDR family oxidoreductase [Croceimicrobium hydrocarbonivorans]
MNSLEGKVAFITGGNKGIGFGIAQALLEQGMKVAISSRNLETAQSAAQELEDSTGGKVLPLAVNVREYDHLESACGNIIAKFGRLDVLVANAGIGHFAPIDEMEPAKWEELIDTNVNGVFYSIKACVDALKKTKGYIFTISSLAGTNFFPTASAYNASKFAVTGMTQSIMLDLRKYDIRVSTIMPGSVTSHFNGHTPTAEDAWKIQPEDIGELLVDLLKINPRTLPSKVEVRPSRPPGA